VTTLQAYIAGIGVGRAVADCMRGAEASSASLSGAAAADVVWKGRWIRL